MVFPGSGGHQQALTGPGAIRFVIPMPPPIARALASHLGRLANPCPNVHTFGRSNGFAQNRQSQYPSERLNLYIKECAYRID